MSVSESTTASGGGPPVRQLPCGCWEMLIEGDIITSSVQEWVLTIVCNEHAWRP